MTDLEKAFEAWWATLPHLVKINIDKPGAELAFAAGAVFGVKTTHELAEEMLIAPRELHEVELPE